MNKQQVLIYLKGLLKKYGNKPVSEVITLIKSVEL